MRQLDYTNIFWTLLSVRWTIFFAAFVFAFLFLWINLRQAAITSADFDIGGQAEKPGFWSRLNVVTRSGFKFSPKFVMLDIALGSAAAALLFGAGSTRNGTLTFAFVTARPLACRTRCLSRRRVYVFICRSMSYLQSSLMFVAH